MSGPINKMQSDQMVNEAALPVLRLPARTQLDTLSAALDKNADSPMRVYAANPADAKLYFAPQQFSLADGRAQSIPPISSQIPQVVASTVDFQTNLSTGATFAITWPTTGTIGQFRRVGFTLLSSGQINAIFSGEAASVAALANAGTLFISGALPLGFVDLQCTGTAGGVTQYKTAGSATNIIENAVSGTARVVVFGSGGGGGGSGNANELLERLKDELEENYFNYMTPNIFAQGKTLVDEANTTATSDPTDNSYLFSAASQVNRSLQLLDVDFLSSMKDVVTAKLTAFWKLGQVDPAAIYEISRDGAINWQVIEMDQIGTNDAFTGTLTFADTETNSVLQSYLVANANSTSNLDTTTRQQVSYPFVVTAAETVKALEVYVTKSGTPGGNMILSIAKDSSGNPGEIVGSTQPISITALASGNNTVLASLMGAAPLASGTYHLIIQTDATYKAGYVATTNEIDLRINSAGPGPALRINDGTSWSAGTGSGCFRVLGRSLDLRVRVTSSTSNVKLFGFGVSYDSTPILLSGKVERQLFTFEGSENKNTFQVTNFLPSVDTLKVYDVATGQVWVSPAFDINGQFVTFPVNTFNQAGQTVYLSFDQTDGSVIDSAPQNANNIASIKNTLAAGTQGFVEQIETMAVPFTAIVNRAPIPVLTQDLRASMGIERVSFQQLFELQNEFGPNGERVFGALNDDRGLIRMVGNWVHINDNSGARVQGNTVGDYIEVTFYGTGLNLLTILGGTAATDYRVSVDGGTEGSNIYPAGSTVLAARNHAANQILQVATGLALGVHTVKIRCNGINFNLNTLGFEIINAASTINVNPGSSYIAGQKISTTNAQLLPYNSDFETGTLGTRGGRVVVYQKSDGSIAKAVQPVNASQGNLTSADHLNEEVIRKYNFREFGAGRSDDFSSLITSSSNRAFTLEDGTTTLVGAGVTASAFAGRDTLSLFDNNSFVTFTFVGTGLDIINSASGSLTLGNAIVDGTNVGGYTRTPSNFGRSKIVSGLPYGTHTVKLTMTAGGGAAMSDFIVYGPKKPSIPSGAIELADYNVMADYVAVTATTQSVAQGVLRKTSIREVTYVGGWSASVDANFLGGHNSSASTVAGHYWEYTFFGIGLELRTLFQATAHNFTITIDGSSNLSAFSPALVTSGGSMAINASTGVVTGTGSGAYGQAIRITGLSLGVHKIRIFNNVGSNNIYCDAIDIITPIHSPKSSDLAVIQNALPTGSCAISDNRKTSMIKEALPAQKSWAQAIGVSVTPTTTSTVLIPCPDMSLTIKTSGGPLEVGYSIVNYNSTTGSSVNFQIFVNGVAVGTEKQQNQAGNLSLTTSELLMVPLGAGTHKVDVYWKVSANTGTVFNIMRSLTARER